jgi:S1-C subfamily serine protease
VRAALRISYITILLGLAHSLPVWAAGPDYLIDSLPAGQAMSPQAMSPSDIAVGNVGFGDLSMARVSNVLHHLIPDSQLATRGVQEEQIYRRISPSVVMVVTEKALGSGSVISPGEVLTNWHVIDGAKEVGIIFKPAQEGEKITAADLVRGKVVKVDGTRDLAIVQYAMTNRQVQPIELGKESDIEVGADVNAIGHPTGETWTYTRGIISQFRKDFEWKAEGVSHKADVIQTQTPISPGSSGGPLLSDAGALIGVNSFKAEGEGLNFAISIEDVRRFIVEPLKTVSAPKRASTSKCEPRVLYKGRDKDNTSFIELIDTRCNGKGDMLYRVPDDKRRSIALIIDTVGTGRPDFWVYDPARNGKWKYSLIESNHDGRIDLIGHHPDGKVIPTWFEPYRGQPTPWAN